MSDPNPIVQFMSDQARGISVDYIGNQKGNCGCDFHQGRWGMNSLTFSGMFTAGPLVYAKEGDPLPPFPYCNKPKHTSALDDVQNMVAALEAGRKAAYAKPSKTGYNCRECRTFNEYASSNQPGDKYLCFNCRC